jgi:hypothetical protein
MKTEIKIAASSIFCFVVPMGAAAYFNEAIFNAFLGFVFGILAVFLAFIILSNDSEK